MPILVFLGLSVLDLGPMYATDVIRRASSLNASALSEQRHNNRNNSGGNCNKILFL